MTNTKALSHAISEAARTAEMWEKAWVFTGRGTVEQRTPWAFAYEGAVNELYVLCDGTTAKSPGPPLYPKP